MLGYNFNSYGGMEVIQNSWLVDKIRRKIHRKKRIDKKYLKRFGHKEVPKKDFIVMGNKLIGHPKTIKKFEKLWNKK